MIQETRLRRHLNTAQESEHRSFLRRPVRPSARFPSWGTPTEGQPPRPSRPNRELCGREAGREGLKSQPRPEDDRRLVAAQRKVGELQLEVDILRELLEKKGSPPSPRRSR